MCSIFGYLGKKDPLKTTLEGLKLLEYRGYDSSGIAGLQDGKLIVCKEIGKLQKLVKKARLKDLKLELAIGHTRWATHGKPSVKNAHPHCDSKKKIALVHNGIIENYESLRLSLSENGVRFHTKTDTEVLAQLIAYQKKKTLLQSVFTSIKEIKGSFAFALIHKDFPNEIIAAARDCPLAIGYNEDLSEIIVSSDPNAFETNWNVIYLSDDEIAHIERGKITLYDKNCHLIQKKAQRIEKSALLADKGHFEHFMLKEIFEQPKTIIKAMQGRINEEKGTAFFEELEEEELRSIKEICIVACGTSWHAGLLGAHLLEDLARLPARVEIASEFRYRNPILSKETLVLAISQSGETADTLAAVRHAKAGGAKVLGLCNVKNSTLTREAKCLYLQAGPEISVCSTKAFTSQLTLLFLLALFFGRMRYLSKEEGDHFLEELQKIPNILELILLQKEALATLAKRYSKYENFFFLGRSYMYPTALEAALKLKEISYLHASCYPAGEMKHGPIALLSSSFPIVAFTANEKTEEKMKSNLQEAKARKAPILAFSSSKSLEGIADDLFLLPKTIDPLAPFPATVAGQLFAYYIAKERGRDIDKPRNLAKSVTVE